MINTQPCSRCMSANESCTPYQPKKRGRKKRKEFVQPETIRQRDKGDNGDMSNFEESISKAEFFLSSYLGLFGDSPDLSRRFAPFLLVLVYFSHVKLNQL